jgi:hypothetical protein
MASERARRLRDADAEELARIVREELALFSVEEARQALRNPFAGADLPTALLARDALAASYELQRDLVLHPRTPQTLALRLVPQLFLRDLVRVGGDARVPPVVRRAADLRVIERLPALPVGERVSLARAVSATVLAQLRFDPTPRVIEAMLENPRLHEGLLVQLAASETAVPAVLALLASSSRWGSRYDLRVALSRNPRTPVATALALLASLRKPDLRAVAGNPRLPAPLRDRARLLLGDR